MARGRKRKGSRGRDASAANRPSSKVATWRTAASTDVVRRWSFNRPAKPTVASAAILVALAAAAFMPAVLWGGFVWDDVILTESTAIREWSGLWKIWLRPSEVLKGEGHYWPIVYTTFWLEYRLWELEPMGYHAVNVLFHAANCLLIWRLALRLEIPGAFLAAALFAVHPVHVESVAWVIERKDVLSGFFYLSAALTWIRFVGRPRRHLYCLALIYFVAGMLSKSVVITLPAAMLIWHWWKCGRVGKVDMIRILPFFGSGAVITAFDLSRYLPGEAYSFDFTLVERALIAARALWFYVVKLAWPTDLAVVYPRWNVEINDPTAWALIAATLVLISSLWILRHRIGRGPLVGVIFFILTLSPVLGFIDYGYMQFSFVADRYQYLACFGILSIVSAIFATVTKRLPKIGLQTARTGAAAVVLILVAVSWRQAGIYSDNIRFYSHIAGQNPLAWKVDVNLSRAQYLLGQLEEALESALRAQRNFPDDPAPLTTIGAILIKQERYEEAEQHLIRARELDPGNLFNLQNLAALLQRTGRYEDAIEVGRKVLQLVPPDSTDAVPIHLIMGKAAANQGQFDLAREYYKNVLDITPEHVPTLEALGELVFERGLHATALEYFRAVAEIEPDNAAAYSNIGLSLYKLDNPEGAMFNFNRALALDPDLEVAKAGRRMVEEQSDSNPEYDRNLNLGRELLDRGQLEEALAATRKAQDLKPDSMEAFVNLGGNSYCHGKVLRGGIDVA